MKIELVMLKCKRCGYEWTPRKQNVRQCPGCKTTYWNKEKKGRGKNVQQEVH